MIFVQAFQLPLEIAEIAVGVWLIHTGDTAINLTGAVVASTVVARSEGWRKDEASAAGRPRKEWAAETRLEPVGR